MNNLTIFFVYEQNVLFQNNLARICSQHHIPRTVNCFQTNSSTITNDLLKIMFFFEGEQKKSF